MPSLASLLGKPERRGKFLVGGHLIVGVIGFIIMLAFWLFKIIAFWWLTKPIQLYPFLLTDFYPIVMGLSLVIISTVLAKYDNKYLALSLDLIGLVSIIISVVGNIVTYIYGAGFAWKCYMNSGSLGSTDEFICTYGPGTDQGPNYAFASLWFNVVFSIWLLIALVVYIGDLMWTMMVKWHEERKGPWSV